MEQATRDLRAGMKEVDRSRGQKAKILAFIELMDICYHHADELIFEVDLVDAMYLKIKDAASPEMLLRLCPGVRWKLFCSLRRVLHVYGLDVHILQDIKQLCHRTS